MEHIYYESRIQQIQAILDSLIEKVDGLPDIHRDPIKVDVEALSDRIKELELNFPDLEQTRQPAETERDRLRALLQSMSDEVWFCDLDGNVTLMNDVAPPNLGIERPEELNRPLNEVVQDKLEITNLDGTPRPAEETPLFRSLKGETVRGQEIVRNSRTGERVFREYVSSPIRSKENEITGAVAVVRDITGQKEVEVHHRLLEYREMERQKIARDLHDGPVQSLGGLSFSLKVLQEITQDPAFQEMIEQIREDVKHQVKELREVCNELRPPLLAQFGLGKAIYSHARSFEEKHPGLMIILELDGADDSLFEALPENSTLALYRIYQEALNNVVRHANASRVIVRLSLQGENIVFEIQDNGKGFQPTGNWVELVRGGHYGLVGMKERAEAVGGTFIVVTRPGNGTTIRVEIARKI